MKIIEEIVWLFWLIFLKGISTLIDPVLDIIIFPFLHGATAAWLLVDTASDLKLIGYDSTIYLRMTVFTRYSEFLFWEVFSCLVFLDFWYSLWFFWDFTLWFFWDFLWFLRLFAPRFLLDSWDCLLQDFSLFLETVCSKICVFY